MTYRKLAFLLAGMLSWPVAQADSLQEIYRLALENDPQLKADTAAYQAGKEATNIGRAALLPQINAQASVQKTDRDDTDNLLVNGSNLEQDQTSWNITLNQALFDLSAWYGYQQGKASTQQAEEQFKADQQSLMIRSAQAYFNVLRAIDNLETAEAEEKALAQQLEQTQQRFEVGISAITDVHEAQAAYDIASATRLEAEGNLGISYEALEVLTGQPHNTIAPLQSNFPVLKPEPAERHAWVEFALQNNQALKVARHAAEAAQQNSRARTADHAPTLTGFVSYTDTDNDGTNANVNFDSHSETEVYTIRLDVPIFTGGRTSGLRRQAVAQSLQAKEIANRTQRDIIQATRSLHLQVSTDVARIKARNQAVTSSQSALDATQAGYEVGTRNLVDILNAQRALFQARRNYSNSLYDYIINTLQLKEAAGTLSPNDITELDQWLNKQGQIAR